MNKFKQDFLRSFHAARENIWRQKALQKVARRNSRRRKPFYKSFRFWLNILIIIFIILVIYFAWPHINCLWQGGNAQVCGSDVALLSSANLWILLLLIPFQFFSYYASTEIFFTYLRARGQLKNTTTLQAAEMGLELNFVNHVAPSGGVSGVAYMVWRLGKLGVSAGQATMSEIMRYVVQMSTFMVLMAIALIWATLENRTANWVVVAVAIGITALIFIVIFGGYLVGSRERLLGFARFLTRGVNKIARKISFGKKSEVLELDKTEKFFSNFHEDFAVLKNDKKLLVRPIIWSFLFNIFDISLFFISFAALGYFINPAILLIAYGAATLSGIFSPTPGGAGAYEILFVSVLTGSGVPFGIALAGVILTRAILILGTLLSGFFAFQHASKKFGRPEFAQKVDFTPDEEISRAKNKIREKNSDKKDEISQDFDKDFNENSNENSNEKSDEISRNVKEEKSEK